MRKSAEQMEGHSDRAIKKSVSLPGSLFALAVSRQRGQRFATFSDYFQDLVRRDTKELEAAIGRR